ncbi:DUF4419 domain-containing protein [Kitasatospora sp. NPDC006697]|uniref:DUF4419 domain-containing protein n=1 Tax=Kitasatospora sp. NPDC006697 TaxID=3364020 RepID=UPI00368C6950
MAIEIDLPLTPAPAADAAAADFAAELTDVGNERFLRAVLQQPARYHHLSSGCLIDWPDDADVVEPDITADSLLLRAVHLAFMAHLPLSLAPDLLWYAVVHEVAVHIRLNSGTYAAMFTDTPGYRQTVVIRDDAAGLDWERSIGLVQAPLRERIGAETAELFLPAFSTTGPTDAAAVLVALMDVVSPYYAFRWRSMCGIPRIRLEGTAEDWQLLADRVRGLAGRFAGLRAWFDGLLPVVDTIAATAAGREVDEEFWRSLYKYESRSGGASITGWISAFFAHRYTGDGPVPKEASGPGRTANDEVPSHVSQVPFHWETPAGTLGMAFLAGVLSIEREEEGGWIRPRLGTAVAEPAPPPALPGRLPDPWTPAVLHQLFPGAEIEPLDSVGAVLYRRELLEVDNAFLFNDVAVVRALDGDWYVGDLVSDRDNIVCWGNFGPDLPTALAAI